MLCIAPFGVYLIMLQSCLFVVGTMELGKALHKAGTLNAYCAAMAAELAELPPVELVLHAKHAVLCQVWVGGYERGQEGM